MNIEKLFQQFNHIKAGVIGDVMLDSYWWGHVDRISPEAPVPIVALENKEYRIGGAGNVALNLASLGAAVSVFSVIGNDSDGEKLSALLDENNIATTYIIRKNSRKTTNKIRIMSRSQQMMRLDEESIADLQPSAEDLLLQRLEEYLEKEKPAVIIFEDYNKGVLTKRVITEGIELCRKHNVLTTVDPKKKNFFAYKHVDIFKPNLKEVREGLNMTIDKINIEQLQRAHEALHSKLQHNISFFTLSEHGVFYQHHHNSAIIPSHLRNIADVSGAGDTVISVASLVYAITKNEILMAEIANIAGGLVCEVVGTATIDKNLLYAECKSLLSPHIVIANE